MSESQASARRGPRRPAVLIPLALVVGVLLVLALAAFEPWTLFTDETVDEALPTVTAPLTPEPGTPGPSPTELAASEPVSSETATTPAASPKPENAVLARGSFISHEHATSGDVRILELADGSRVLRVEGLDTSNGPDLHVWITDAPVVEGRDGWFVFDDGAYVDLGPLKGNQGNQNYALPDDVDLDELTSVSIWCQRFHVSFGAAALT